MIELGLKENTERGVGTRFGPDVTEVCDFDSIPICKCAVTTW